MSENTAKTELLPCPFCGATPTGVSVHICDYGIFNDVFCPTRECRGSQGVSYEPQNGPSAIAAWNRRAHTPSIEQASS